MQKALATLLQGVIDYAGLFPPASLELSDATALFKAYQTGPQSDLVSRFACPSSRLHDLLPRLDTNVLPLTVIGSPGEWEDARETDARTMNDFLKGAGDRADIQAYEVRLPMEREVDRCLRELNGFSDVQVFVEIPWEFPIAETMSLLVQSEIAYAKARTGGETTPTVEQLSEFLHSAISLDWQHKLTAGLHRLFPDHGQHGLVSTVGSVALALGEDLSQREIGRVLEADASEWRFGPESLTCMGFEANLDDIEAARDLFVSVGSCSVEEPYEELRTLGLVGGERR